MFVGAAVLAMAQREGVAVLDIVPNIGAVMPLAFRPTPFAAMSEVARGLTHQSWTRRAYRDGAACLLRSPGDRGAPDLRDNRGIAFRHCNRRGFDSSAAMTSSLL